ncbi:MAG: helix-turn-helix domain-containing protein [Spirosomataceae bacterium]|jgi:predicted DNA-binding transcriptional regulator AlpA
MEKHIQELLTVVQNLNAKIENLEKINLSSKSVLSLEEFCIYTGYSKSRTYKLTSARLVPHSKPMDKSIFFSKEEIDQWLLQNPVKTISALHSENKTSRKPSKFKF